MQLDRIPPSSASLVEDSGTPLPHTGVWQGDASLGNALERRPRAGLGGWLFVIALAGSVLGQGERCRVDRRFVSPSATLTTYWEALRANDEVAIGECMLDGPQEEPFAGMLWFMPPTDEIHLESFRSLPITGGRVMVTYDVRFRPIGADEDQRFPSGNELVRQHGMWRIARGLGNASMPEWKPIRRPVDI